MEGTIGRYRILAHLGSGSVGEVYLAVREGWWRRKPVALKCLRAALARDFEAQLAFADEARLLARVRHPRIARLLGTGSHRGLPFHVLEYAPGPTLFEVMARLRSLGANPPAAAVVSLGVDLLDALSAAHEAIGSDGLPLAAVHRDVTPRNLILCTDGACKLTDFGLARFRLQSHHTLDGELRGTAAYLAPEQLHAAFDARADLWSAAVVLFELSTLRNPFEGECELESLLNASRREVPSLAVQRRDFPPGLSAAIEAGLDRDPRRRFQTAREFRGALLRLCPRRKSRESARELVRLAFPGGWPEAGHFLRRAGLALAAILLAAAPARAQPAAPAEGRTAAHDEVDSALVDDARNHPVVTASGVAEAQALASANVTTVGWEEISRRRYRSLGEILADIPGLYVVDDLVLPSLGVRGVTGGLRAGTRIVKVMVNGVPVGFRPELTAFLGPEYIPVQMIERVEVAKGPLSALYGANAFIATVNVITRPQAGSALVMETSARAMAHSGGTGFGGSLLGGFSDGRHSLLVAAVGEQLDRSGLSVPRTFPEQDPELSRYRPFFAGASADDLAAPRGLFAQYAGTSAIGALSLQGGFQLLDAMGEFQLNSVMTHQSREALENLWASARHERAWSKDVSSSAWAAWSKGSPGTDERLFLTGTQQAFYRRGYGYWAVDGGAEVTVLAKSELSLKGGLDFNHEQQRVLHFVYTPPLAAARAGEPTALVGPSDRLDVALDNFGAYFQGTFEPGADLRLTGNLRLDVPSFFPAQPTWRLAAARRWSDWLTTKAVLGQAYQTPSATLLFGLPGFGSANNVIGNRTLSNVLPLSPQKVNSVELAASVQLFGRLAVEAAVYGQQVDEKIEFVQSGSNFYARNQGQEQGVGGEAILHLALGRLTASGSAEVVRAFSDGALRARPPPLYPSHRFTAELNLALPEVHLAASGRLSQVGPRGSSQSNAYLNNDTPYSLPAYTTVDLHLSTVGLSVLGAAQTAVSLSVRNLLDTRYSEPGFGGHDIPTLGRLALLELRQTY